MIKADVIDRTKSIGLVTATALVAMMARSGEVFAGDCDPTTSVEGIGGGIQCSAGDSQENTSLFGADGGIFRTITNVLLFLVGAISVIMLIIGGVRYVISGGDQQAVTNAKNTILYAIVGIVVAFLAFAAVDFVVAQLETTNN